jgi:hypothetical protein
MGDFPISRGGGQFTFVPLTLCDFSTFQSQTTEGDPDETDMAPLPGLIPCDYGSQCLAALGHGTFQPMLRCNMTVLARANGVLGGTMPVV